MKILKKIALAAVLVAAGLTGLAATTGSADAHQYRPLYKHHTKFGVVKFYNKKGHWPVVRKFKRWGRWYQCDFWKNHYDCGRIYPRRAFYWKKRFHGHKKRRFGFSFKKHY